MSLSIRGKRKFERMNVKENSFRLYNLLKTLYLSMLQHDAKNNLLNKRSKEGNQTYKIYLLFF